MRRILVSLLPAAALALAAAPAFAEIYTPNGGTYPSGGGVKLPASTYATAPAEATSPLMVLEAPLAMMGAGAAATNPHPNCGVLRDFNGRYTALCSP